MYAKFRDRSCNRFWAWHSWDRDSPPTLPFHQCRRRSALLLPWLTPAWECGLKVEFVLGALGLFKWDSTLEECTRVLFLPSSCQTGGFSTNNCRMAICCLAIPSFITSTLRVLSTPLVDHPKSLSESDPKVMLVNSRLPLAGAKAIIANRVNI